MTVMKMKRRRARGVNLCLPLRSEQRSWTGKGTSVHLVFFICHVTWCFGSRLLQLTSLKGLGTMLTLLVLVLIVIVAA